jgi:hypothetical protein
MTLEELKSLREGEVVILTKVDERITEYNNFSVGDEMTFHMLYEYDFPICGQVDFLRNSITISPFSYEICDYIERKVELRDRKLKELGI